MSDNNLNKLSPRSLLWQPPMAAIGTFLLRPLKASHATTMAPREASLKLAKLVKLQSKRPAMLRPGAARGCRGLERVPAAGLPRAGVPQPPI